MKFGKIFVNKSLNGILAHSMVIEGKKLKKGKIINKTDISLFKRHGIKKITCAILNEKDIVMLVDGGHGFKVIKDVEMIEVKQGPYNLIKDKVKFSGIYEKNIKIKKN